MKCLRSIIHATRSSVDPRRMSCVAVELKNVPGTICVMRIVLLSVTAILHLVIGIVIWGSSVGISVESLLLPLVPELFSASLDSFNFSCAPSATISCVPFPWCEVDNFDDDGGNIPDSDFFFAKR